MRDGGLQWEEARERQDAWFWANKSPKLFGCRFCNRGIRGLGDPQSTGKHLPECVRGARGWRKEVLCRDVCLLGVKQSLNVPFNSGLTGAKESTGCVSETGLWRVALLDLCDHRCSFHRAAPTASLGKARSGSELGTAYAG